MSTRKFLMYLDGLLSDSRTAGAWYARSVMRDYDEIQAEKVDEAERLARAENAAQIAGRPLDMAELDADWVLPD